MGPRGALRNRAMLTGTGHSQKEHSASPWMQQTPGEQSLKNNRSTLSPAMITFIESTTA